ncbi:MAG: fructokinase [Gammaproteobacteria bacterium CG11_big_fil_rev_8_21_14_0_20_46_22]|nr:MAG: fructokinase [Gammaproteobacteria bacterium CG12_big_fil_rev_8_21_14_0_65_46_12]PIR10062.1 MAG: fructokinase [Gammaproteobacteria bacterium CG11_big_fil_rev_8_21_14_0_20_46_22]
MSHFIGIEAGGTKFVVAHGPDGLHLSDRHVIATTTPDETMAQVLDYISQIQREHTVSAIGAGVFGPLDPDPSSPHYGHITTTPKKAWQQFNFVGFLQEATGLPIGFDTDVNAAALGEHRWGAAQGLSDFVYITVGTGIGGGAMVNGKLLHGAMHTEMGHMLMPQDLAKDPFEGVCPFHHNCLEGLASGPAMMKRWHVESALDLPADHVAWALESDYLAAAAANYTFCLSPKRIIFGGGVMNHPGLIEKICPKTLQAIAGYVKNATVTEGINDYIVLPGLGDNAGIAGAIALAEGSLG